MKMKKLDKIVVILFSVCCSIFIYNLIGSQCQNKTEYNYSEIETENVYNIWKETSIGTDISSQAYRELDRRGYWDEKNNQNEEEAIKIFNYYNEM